MQLAQANQAEIRQGRIVIVVDDEDRENEGDFIMAAEKCTPEWMNVLIKHGSGYVCAPTTAARLAEAHPFVAHPQL